MNWDEVAGKWKEHKGRIREQWGKFTNDDLEMIAGKRDQLIGAIQKRYGIAREAAEEQVRKFEQQPEPTR